MILGTNMDIKVNLFLDGNKIEIFQKVVLLRTTIDDKLNVKAQTESICRTVKYKLNTLQRIRKYLSTDIANCNAFISSQFYYAPLIWMFDTLMTQPMTQIMMSYFQLIVMFQFIRASYIF